MVLLHAISTVPKIYGESHVVLFARCDVDENVRDWV